MKGFAVHNAKTTHGGTIPAAQTHSVHMGTPFLRAGDGHYCPQCKCWSTIQASHNHVIFDGQPAAYEHDFLSCGAQILPQQNHMVGDSQGSSITNTSEPVQEKSAPPEPEKQNYNLKFQLKDNLGHLVKNTKYLLIDEETHETSFGHTDAEGFTEDIWSEKEKKFSVHLLLDE